MGVRGGWFDGSPTFCSQIGGEAIAGGPESQALVRIGAIPAQRGFATALVTVVTDGAGGAKASRKRRDWERDPSGHRGTELLTVREAAQLLRVSTATIYRMCATGVVPSVRVLNSIRIWLVDIGLGRGTG